VVEDVGKIVVDEVVGNGVVDEVVGNGVVDEVGGNGVVDDGNGVVDDGNGVVDVDVVVPSQGSHGLPRPHGSTQHSPFTGWIKKSIIS